MIHICQHFLKDQDGATLVEYALMVLLIALVAFAAVTLLGINVSGLFSDASLNSALS
jgi:pilus assembly protein Flp/PilA